MNPRKTSRQRPITSFRINKMPPSANSIKGKILNYLKVRNGAWVMGGTLERDIGDIMRAKSSNVGRRLRELENAGIIERDIIKIGKVWAVQYRLKPLPQPAYKPKTLQELIREKQMAMI